MADRSPRAFLLCLVQGVLIGAGGILPGVSGGVLAVVFGVYRPAMEVLAHPKRALPRHWRLLLPVGVGAALGFLGGAGGVLTLLAHSQVVSTALFFGLILGTLPSLWRAAGAHGRSRGAYAALLAGFALPLAVFALLRFGLFAPLPQNRLGFLLAGAILALGTIVPGLAASPLLMAVGLFYPMLEGVRAFDLSVLLPLALGLAAALAALSRFVSFLFRAHYAVAYHAVFGVVLASLLSIVPTSFASVGEALAALAAALLGAAAAFCTARLRAPERSGK